MSRIKPSHIIAAAIAGLLGGTSVAMAEGADVGELAGAAKVVVHGRASKVEYRMSRTGTNGQPAVPYTIVTVDVLDVARGTMAARTITLRFIGGPDGRGGFLEASNVPVFQVGDEDILFVQDNGEAACPLVQCIEGRFRVLGNAVYDGRGTPVAKIAAKRVVAEGAVPTAFRQVTYPAPSFDELLKNPEVAGILRKRGLSVEEARRRYAAEAPRNVTVETVLPEASTALDSPGAGGSRAAAFERAAQPISVGQFLSSLTVAGGAEAAGSGGTFRSTTADAQIPAPSNGAAGPSAPAVAERAGPLASPADLAEQRAQPKDDATVTRRKGQGG